MKDSILTKNQTKKVTADNVLVDGERVDIAAELRYDDQCGNGHNSFAITGEYYEAGKPKTDRNMIACGCVHEAIEQAFPELKPFIKWHLMSSDEPMHYVSNTMYHARDCDTEGKKAGDVIGYDTRLKFYGVSFTFSEQENGFWEYLDNMGDFNNIEVEAVAYDGADSYDFSDNYSLTGFIKENESKQWYKAPFKSKRAASEFLTMLQEFGYEYIKTPYKWAKAEKVDIDAARNSAVWSDATLEQLQSREALEARLPQLVADFADDMELLGFTY